jgi:hypothetical protein
VTRGLAARIDLKRAQTWESLREGGQGSHARRKSGAWHPSIDHGAEFMWGRQMTKSCERARIPIGDDLPWSGWQFEAIRCERHDLKVYPEKTASGGNRLRIRNTATERSMGWVHAEGIRALGDHLGFPGSYAQELPATLQADLINYHLQTHENEEVAVLTDEDRFAALVTGSSDQLKPAEVAQTAYDAARSRGAEATIEQAVRSPTGMRLRLMTDIRRSISPSVGDILEAGLLVTEEYGDQTSVQVYTRRLLCLNGMTAMQSVFRRARRQVDGYETQLRWLIQSVNEALDGYQDLVRKARQMAVTPVEGDPEEALLERAAALGYPRRLHDRLQAAFREEPGHTAWHLLNAFTRVATHTPLPNGLGRRVQAAAGAWVSNFDLVTARLPRLIALQVGAHIIGSGPINN